MNAKTNLVAEITGIDEYGPVLAWHTHWVDLGVGTKLFTSPVEAALAGAGAVAWREVVKATGRVRSHIDWEPNADMQEVAQQEGAEWQPLFTHPTPVAVGVDEAMVEAACLAFYGDDWLTDTEQNDHARFDMRAALTAALEAKPHA